MSNANTDNLNDAAVDDTRIGVPTKEHRVPAEFPNGSRRILSTTAASWYLSLGIHFAGYAAAAVAFWWLGLTLSPERPDFRLPPIHASLGDEAQVDDRPALQMIPVAGPNSAEEVQSLQQLASQLALSDRGQVDSVVADAKISAIGSDDSDAGDDGDSPFFRLPESGLAVTKGIFTAWTDPAHPVPGQSYQIIIEIQLPDKIKRYRLSDLSGVVTGTDRYRQFLPFDRRTPGAARVTGGAAYETVRRNMTVEITGKKLQLAIKVPGAKRLVKDRIRIKSKRLREEQELILVFGSSEQALGLELGDD